MIIRIFFGIILLRMMFLMIENLGLIEEDKTIMGVVFHLVLAFAYLFAASFLAWMCDPSNGVITIR